VSEKTALPPVDEAEKLVLSPLEAARAVGLSRNQIYEEVSTGRLASKRVGRRILIPKTAIAEWLNSDTPVCN